METSTLPGRQNLKLKFTGLYILSVALILFIFWFLIHRTAPANTTITATKPVESSDVPINDLLNQAEVLTSQYQDLKQLDQNYSRKMIDSVNVKELDSLSLGIGEAEKKFEKKIDSIEIITRAYPDSKASKLLRSMITSFRSVINDRSSMQAYKTSVLSKGDSSTNLQFMLRMQDEIQARNNRISVLENHINLIEGRSALNFSLADNVVANQQNIDGLRATISTQEKKITSLTTANATLEKLSRENSEALELAKASSDNSSTDLKAQSVALEKRVNDLNTEIRLAQVDCNLSRVDATQIVSNARQRKALLSDALNTLNYLAVNGDAMLKKRVLEKINRLNQVASTLRD